MKDKNLPHVKELCDVIFKDSDSITLNRDNLREFLLKTVKESERIGKAKLEQKERTIIGSNIKSEDLDMVAKNIMIEVGSFLNFAEYIEMLYEKYKDKKIEAPLYDTREKVDNYRMELGKLFHSITVKLRLAKAFGFGDIESTVGVVNTSKLPTPKEAKKMDSKQMKKYMDKITDNTGKIDNKSTKTFKDDDKK